MAKVSNERKNLHRLAGEFLVASRLSQRGFMTALQWGNVISYDILAFDKEGNSAFIEVKSTASHTRRWVMQKKYADPKVDAIPLDRRFVCCVDLTPKTCEPKVFVFPARVVAEGLKYYFSGKFPNSESYHLSLDFRPVGRTKVPGVLTVGQFIRADEYLESWDRLGIKAVTA
uniref:DUF3883 domain-containing protein n=1 Tax=Schlesneria paludicola TaxID=360056 RepID=A0A7C2JW68_9PLAN